MHASSSSHWSLWSVIAAPTHAATPSCVPPSTPVYSNHSRRQRPVYGLLAVLALLRRSGELLLFAVDFFVAAMGLYFAEPEALLLPVKHVLGGDTEFGGNPGMGLPSCPQFLS